MSIFAPTSAGGAGRSALFEMQAGKATLAGTTVTSDPRKGLLLLRKSEDGLMHLVWKERSSPQPEDDLIVFQGDATIRHLPQCKDGYVMLLEFTQTKRKLFFWSQERRKKGIDFAKEEDNVKEKELIEKANRVLNGTPEPAPAAATGFGGLTHSELIAMLGGAAAAAPTASDAAPAAAPAAAEPFSSDAISSILGNLGTAPAPAAAAPAPGGPAAPFSAAALSNILASVQQQSAPVPLGDVLGAAAEGGVVDAPMEQRLAEHLPQTGGFGESAASSLTTPQVQQAANAFTEALNSGTAGPLIAEMGLNPSGLGVEPFLRALQDANPPTAEAMDTDEAKPTPEATDEGDKMDDK